MEGYEQNRYAASTRTTRGVQVVSYLKFVDEFKGIIEPYPCSNNQMCMYVVYLARRLTYQSIRNYVSALSTHFKDMGLPAVDYECHQLKKCLMGIKRVKGDYVKKATPLLPIMILKIFSTLCQVPSHTSVRAAMLLSFRTLLRKAHVTESDASLCRSDFEFKTWGMLVSVRKSKTNQFRQRVHVIPVNSLPDKRLCAVYWARRHFSECPAPANYKAFRMPKAGNSIPLSYTFYQAVIKEAAARVEIDPSNVSTHSLRRGGANFLRTVGVSVMEIKEVGEWKSDCVYQYLETSLAERLTTDLRVATVLSTF